MKYDIITYYKGTGWTEAQAYEKYLNETSIIKMLSNDFIHSIPIYKYTCT